MARRKPSPLTTGRLQSLRLFSTLLACLRQQLLPKADVKEGVEKADAKKPGSAAVAFPGRSPFIRDWL